MNNIILDTLEIVYNITHILLKNLKAIYFPPKFMSSQVIG